MRLCRGFWDPGQDHAINRAGEVAIPKTVLPAGAVGVHDLTASGAKVCNDAGFFFMPTTEKAKDAALELLGAGPSERQPQIAVAMVADL